MYATAELDTDLRSSGYKAVSGSSSGSMLESHVWYGATACDRHSCEMVLNLFSPVEERRRSITAAAAAAAAVKARSALPVPIRLQPSSAGQQQ
jgi:hypothetical protein